MKNIKLCILLILSGCAVPSPIIKLTPSTLEYKDYWNLGQQFVFTTDANIWFDCAFNRFENNKIIFDIKITNESDSAILVDPAYFYEKVYVNDTLSIALNYAYDPEYLLQNLKMEENISHAASKNAATVGIVSAVISGGTMVAVASSKKDAENKRRIINAISTTSELAQNSAMIAAEDADIRAYNNWTMTKTLSETLLRKTTLPIGYFIEGEVQFSYYKNAKWYEINLETQNSKAIFLFKQSIIHPPAR